MARKEDLEQSIRESYGFIAEYEAIIRTSDRPEEKARARRVIDEQWSLVEGYLAEVDGAGIDDRRGRHGEQAPRSGSRSRGPGRGGGIGALEPVPGQPWRRASSASG